MRNDPHHPARNREGEYGDDLHDPFAHWASPLSHTPPAPGRCDPSVTLLCRPATIRRLPKPDRLARDSKARQHWSWAAIIRPHGAEESAMPARPSLSGLRSLLSLQSTVLALAMLVAVSLFPLAGMLRADAASYGGTLTGAGPTFEGPEVSDAPCSSASALGGTTFHYH